MDAHGIKGDIYCLVFSGDTSWLSKVKSLRLGQKIFFVKRVKVFKKGFIATLESINDRNSAEELKGDEVWVDSSIFVSKDGDALFLNEILNFSVEDRTLGKIGKISQFSSNGSQDLLVINDKKKSFEIPFVKEFVMDIDYSAKIIHMNLPEGLLEINDEK